MNSKEHFLNEVIKEIIGRTDESIRVLELGCGNAAYVPAMIHKYSQLEYVGIEPIEDSFVQASKNLEGLTRTTVSSQLGYDVISGLEDASFDVVISFSVLEHVKHLDRFLKLSERYVKKGGIMVHRYDLGHALYPWSFKERMHVLVGNICPGILPERKFVRYVPLCEVVSYYRKLLGADPYKYTYHQMRSHKALEKELTKHANKEVEKIMSDVFSWEFDNSEIFSEIELNTREKLFPTVAVWGIKS